MSDRGQTASSAPRIMSARIQVRSAVRSTASAPAHRHILVATPEVASAAWQASLRKPRPLGRSCRAAPSPRAGQVPALAFVHKIAVYGRCSWAASAAQAFALAPAPCSRLGHPAPLQDAGRSRRAFCSPGAGGESAVGHRRWAPPPPLPPMLPLPPARCLNPTPPAFTHCICLRP